MKAPPSFYLVPYLVLLIAACAVLAKPPSTRNNAEAASTAAPREGEFDFSKGFVGYESCTVNGKEKGDIPTSLWNAVFSLRGTHSVSAVMHSTPDLEVEGFLKGRKGSPDRYGIWLKQGLMARLPEGGAKALPKKLVLDVLEPVSLEKLNREWNSRAKR